MEQQQRTRTRGMKVTRWKIPYFMVPHHLARLTETGVQTLLLIYLMECSQYGYGEIYASYNTMANNCHCTKRTIIKTIPELEELGLIEVTPRPGRTSLIRITIEGVTYTEPVQNFHHTGENMSPPPVKICHPSNKDLVRKSYIRDNKQLDKPWIAPDLPKVKDMDIDLIPIERFAKKFTPRPGKKPLADALKSKSRPKKR